MLVGSFKDLFEIYYFQLNYVHNYIVHIIVLNISIPIVLNISSIVQQTHEH